MDIKELQEVKYNVELGIAAEIQNALAVFFKTTGVSIKGVSVHVLREITVGREMAEYIVEGVSCEIDL